MRGRRWSGGLAIAIVTMGAAAGCGADPGSAGDAVSCAGGLSCNGESCCTTINVPGGSFPMGCSENSGSADYFPDGDGDEIPEHNATVASFALDKYEVTVGRFRKYVEAYVSSTASAPAEGAGAHPAIAGTGWQSEWNAELPPTQAEFRDQLNCGSPYEKTWTDTPRTAAEESRAISCVSWYEAYAFCIWDGGRLATESEWEYAAAGGSENRLYPWGSEEPDCTLANFSTDSVSCGPGGKEEVAAAGSYKKGNGKWGHADLAGNVLEWTFDAMAEYRATQTNNYASTSGSYRVLRGGNFNNYAKYMRAANRNFQSPDGHDDYVGVRCARALQ